MSDWKRRLERAIGEPDAPPVLSRDLLARYAVTARGGAAVPGSTLTSWIRRVVDEDGLRPVQRGLYLNHLRAVPGRLGDTVASFHKDAVVSLNTVLGDAGVLNNPTRAVTALVPLDAGHPPPQLGRRQTKAGTLHFFGVPRRVLEAGEPTDRLEPVDRYDHARATPEKALIDWLYLANSPRSKRTAPARTDIDLALLNKARLRRLAKAAGLGESLDAWLA